MEAKLVDDGQKVLKAIKDNPSVDAHDKKVREDLKKRKLDTIEKRTSYKVTKGPNYAPHKEKLPTALTADMLKSGSWKDTKFKK